MGEIVSNFFEALEKFGRPRGPFEKDRQCIYNATVTARPAPKDDRRPAKPPAARGGEVGVAERRGKTAVLNHPAIRRREPFSTASGFPQWSWSTARPLGSKLNIGR